MAITNVKDRCHSDICQFCLDSHICARLSLILLQASVTKLEQQLADCESALVEETVVSQERKHQAERCQYQVAYSCSVIFPYTFLFY